MKSAETGTPNLRSLAAVALCSIAIFTSTCARATDMPIAGPVGFVMLIWFVAALIGFCFFAARLLSVSLDAGTSEQRLTYLAALAALLLTPVPGGYEYALSGLVWLGAVASPWNMPAQVDAVVPACGLTWLAAWSILAVAGKFRLFPDAGTGTQAP